MVLNFATIKLLRYNRTLLILIGNFVALFLLCNKPAKIKFRVAEYKIPVLKQLTGILTQAPKIITWQLLGKNKFIHL